MDETTKTTAEAANAPTESPACSARSSRMEIASCVAHLTVLFQFARNLLRLEAAWLAGVPYWDAKCMIGRHLLEDARHAEALLARLHELKASGAEHKAVPGLDEVLLEIARAADGDEWLQGCYTAAKPWLLTQITVYLEHSDPLMDAPTHDILRRWVSEVEGQRAEFASFSPRFSSWERDDVTPWTEWLGTVLRSTAIENGRLTVSGRPGSRPPNHPDFSGIATVRRDRTFKTVSERSTMPREGKDFEEQRLLVFYNHSQEMQFAESLGAIMYETAEMPWAFHFDLARHISDEVRHATMGQKRMEQLGTQLSEVPMMTQHYGFRSNLDPLERFCLMTLVMEATAFERKRANLGLFEAHQDEVSARYEAYDIRDEMMHTNLGHVWVPIMLRVYHDSRSVPQLTEHCRAVIAQVITEYPTNAANMVRK